MLYRVRVAEDEYLGTAEEVVAFMARAEGAPGGDAASYMEGVARRIRRMMGVGDVRTDSAEAFLDSLGEHGILAVETRPEPSTQRVDPHAALEGGPVVYGPDVDPGDVAP